MLLFPEILINISTLNLVLKRRGIRIFSLIIFSSFLVFRQDPTWVPQFCLIYKYIEQYLTDFDVTVNDGKLEKVEEIGDIGIILDSELKFKSQLKIERPEST